MRIQRTPSLVRRFLARVDVPGEPDDCWNWTGFVNPYGQILVNGSKMKSHRLSYELFVGDIPAGLIICHRCDNPPCCNPAHLFVGDYSDNAVDMHVKGRSRQARQTHCKHGHELTPQNTRIYNGWRYCRTCSRDWARAHKREQRFLTPSS